MDKKEPKLQNRRFVALLIYFILSSSFFFFNLVINLVWTFSPLFTRCVLERRMCLINSRMFACFRKLFRAHSTAELIFIPSFFFHLLSSLLLLFFSLSLSLSLISGKQVENVRQWGVHRAKIIGEKNISCWWRPRFSQFVPKFLQSVQKGCS